MVPVSLGCYKHRPIFELWQEEKGDSFALFQGRNEMEMI